MFPPSMGGAKPGDVIPLCGRLGDGDVVGGGGKSRAREVSYLWQSQFY